MISSSVRHLVGMALWLGVVCLTLLCSLWAVLEHYLAADAALTLIFQQQPGLHRDGLIGVVLGAFIPNATLTQALAFSLSMAQALGVFMLAHLTFTSLDLWRHRTAARSAADAAQVEEATARLWRVAVMAVPIAAFLFYALRFDMELFRFRALAGSMDIDTPEQARTIAQTLGLTSNAPLSLTLSRLGSEAYAALLALSAWLLEVALDRLADRWSLLMHPVDAWWEGAAHEDERNHLELVEPDALETDVPEPELAAATEADGFATGTGDASAPADASNHVPVIGGAPGETVRFDHARRHPEQYHIDAQTLRVWSRPAWEAMHVDVSVA